VETFCYLYWTTTSCDNTGLNSLMGMCRIIQLYQSNNMVDENIPDKVWLSTFTL